MIKNSYSIVNAAGKALDLNIMLCAAGSLGLKVAAAVKFLHHETAAVSCTLDTGHTLSVVRG